MEAESLSSWECFSCLITNNHHSRTYKIGSKKWEKEGVEKMLITLCGASVALEYLKVLSKLEVTLCRPCLRSMTAACEFVRMLNYNCQNLFKLHSQLISDDNDAQTDTTVQEKDQLEADGNGHTDPTPSMPSEEAVSCSDSMQPTGTVPPQTEAAPVQSEPKLPSSGSLQNTPTELPTKSCVKFPEVVPFDISAPASSAVELPPKTGVVLSETLSSGEVKKPAGIFLSIQLGPIPKTTQLGPAQNAANLAIANNPMQVGTSLQAGTPLHIAKPSQVAMPLQLGNSDLTQSADTGITIADDDQDDGDDSEQFSPLPCFVNDGITPPSLIDHTYGFKLASANMSELLTNNSNKLQPGKDVEAGTLAKNAGPSLLADEDTTSTSSLEQINAPDSLPLFDGILSGCHQTEVVVEGSMKQNTRTETMSKPPSITLSTQQSPLFTGTKTTSVNSSSIMISTEQLAQYPNKKPTVKTSSTMIPSKLELSTHNTYTCFHCDIQFDNFDLLLIHNKMVHKNLGILITCDKLVKKPKPKPVSCNLCNKTFTKKLGLKRHMKLHRNHGRIPCKICGKLLSHKYSLHKHMMIYHTLERPFKCSLCNEGFVDKESLERHVGVHDLPCICELCGKRFKHQVFLDRHLYFHEIRKTRPTTCEICQRSFKSYIALSCHMRAHNGKKGPQNPSQLCDICGKSLIGKSMRHHLKAVHNIEKAKPDPSKMIVPLPRKAVNSGVPRCIPNKQTVNQSAQVIHTSSGFI